MAEPRDNAYTDRYPRCSHSSTSKRLKREKVKVKKVMLTFMIFVFLCSLKCMQYSINGFSGKLKILYN